MPQFGSRASGPGILRWTYNTKRSQVLSPSKPQPRAEALKKQNLPTLLHCNQAPKLNLNADTNKDVHGELRSEEQVQTTRSLRVHGKKNKKGWREEEEGFRSWDARKAQLRRLHPHKNPKWKNSIFLSWPRLLGNCSSFSFNFFQILNINFRELLPF